MSPFYVALFLYCIGIVLPIMSAFHNNHMQPIVVGLTGLLSLIAMTLFGDGCHSLLHCMRDLQLPAWRSVIRKALTMALLCWVAAPALLIAVVLRDASTVLFFADCALAGLLLAVPLRWTLNDTTSSTILWRIALVLTPIALVLAFVERTGSIVTLLVALFLLLGALNTWRWRCLLSTDSSNELETTTHTKAAAFDNRAFHQRRPGTAAILRVFLGEPYAPATLGERARRLTALATLMLLPPLVLYLGNGDYSLEDAWRAWQFAVLPTSWLGAVLCWMMFMYGSQTHLFNTLQANELALLPGLGARRQQLRGLLWAWLGRPALIVVALALPAYLTLRWTHHPAATRLWLWIAAFLLFCGAIAIMHTQAQISRSALTKQRDRQEPMAIVWTITISPVVFSAMFNAQIRSEFHGELIWLGWLASIIVLTFLAAAIQHLVRLARQPHPFMEIAK